jgi:hypothetical protein
MKIFQSDFQSHQITEKHSQINSFLYLLPSEANWDFRMANVNVNPLSFGPPSAVPELFLEEYMFGRRRQVNKT